VRGFVDGILDVELNGITSEVLRGSVNDGRGGRRRRVKNIGGSIESRREVISNAHSSNRIKGNGEETEKSAEGNMRESERRIHGGNRSLAERVRTSKPGGLFLSAHRGAYGPPSVQSLHRAVRAHGCKVASQRGDRRLLQNETLEQRIARLMRTIGWDSHSTWWSTVYWITSGIRKGLTQ